MGDTHVSKDNFKVIDVTPVVPVEVEEEEEKVQEIVVDKVKEVAPKKEPPPPPPPKGETLYLLAKYDTLSLYNFIQYWKQSINIETKETN